VELEAAISRPRTAHRLLFLVIVIGLNLLYIPINRVVTGGVEASLPIDRMIPLWPIWAVPYLLSLVWWIAAFIWAVTQMHDRLFLTFVLAVAMMTLSSYVLYLLYPAYVTRPGANR
jgi:hypothetical protein